MESIELNILLILMLTERNTIVELVIPLQDLLCIGKNAQRRNDGILTLHMRSVELV